MSEENFRSAQERKARVQRLKKAIITLLMIAILIPIVCCVILFVQVAHLNRRIDDMAVQIEQLSAISMEQQQALQSWLETAGVDGQGSAATGQSAPEETDTGILTADSEVQEAGETKRTHKVYLTFDDGPSIYTDEILSILERYQVKATFFVVGKEDEASREALQQIAEAGHTLGLHTYSHKYNEIYRSQNDFASDFTKLQDYVYEVTGQKSTYYRFPGGSSNTVSDIDMHVFADYLAEQGVEFYDWNASSGDASNRVLDVNTLVANATDGIENRGTTIILFHDSAKKRTTVEALPIIIENILAMEDTVILPITEDTLPVHHIDMQNNERMEE